MTDDITLPAKPSGEFVSYCDSYSDGAWRGFDADDMESFARAAVLLDRQQRALRGLAEADRALGLDYADKPAPSAEPVEVYNPWRESLENCINGDNYLRATEYRDLIEELDDLYRLRATSAPSAEPYAWHYWNTGGGSVWHRGPSNRLDADMQAAKDYPRAHHVTPLYTTRPDHTALLRQALEALEKARDTTYSDTLYPQFEVAIDALRAAMEEKR